MKFQLKSATKKLITLFVLFVTTNIYAKTISICEGKFETGQPVYVKINWDNKAVYVNKFHTFIESVVSYGIITGTYTNSLGIDTFSIIGHFPNAGTFIAQQQTQYGQITFTNFARLTCSKSFYKPFTDKMLDN